MNISTEKLARIVDSTDVRATAAKSDIKKLCNEALMYDFGCVCVNPIYVKLAASILNGSRVKVCSTIGFPFGVALSEIKALEAVKAVENGAEELDMVISLGALKSCDYEAVKRDIESVTAVRQSSKGIVVKVILETAFLTDEEKVVACKLVKEGGADFVKTSTGFFGEGATVQDVRLMRQTVGEHFGVKAAGGVRTYVDALAMIEAGANRIGTSTAVAVVSGGS